MTGPESETASASRHPGLDASSGLCVGLEGDLSTRYLHQERVPLVLALNGLDGDVLSFPHGLEDHSKRSSANGLKQAEPTQW